MEKLLIGNKFMTIYTKSDIEILSYVKRLLLIVKMYSDDLDSLDLHLQIKIKSILDIQK